MRKRVFLIIIMSIIMSFFIGTNVYALSSDEIKSKISSLQSIMNGRCWNDNKTEDELKEAVKRGDYGFGLRDSHCILTNPNGKHIKENGCSSNVFNGASQCNGFAEYMAYIISGSNSSDKSNWIEYKGGTLKDIVLEPGDVIRYGEDKFMHSAMVWYTDGDELYVAEANWHDKEKKWCEIHFGESWETISSVKPKLSYVRRHIGITAPAGVTAVANGKKVTVSWDKVEDATSYEVSIVEEPWGIENIITTVETNSTSQTIFLEKDASLAAFVVAKKEDCRSAQSEWASFETKSLMPDINGTMYITNESELRAINNNLSGNYVLKNDIVLTKEWTPIGTEKNPFTGIFSGNGHTIYGLKITDKNFRHSGLFGYIKDGAITSLTIDNCKISTNVAGTEYYLGAIVGYNNKGVVASCSVTGDINMYTRASKFLWGIPIQFEGTDGYAGSIAGHNSGVIKNCNAYADVYVYSGYYAAYSGGIAGTNSGTIFQTQFSGNVSSFTYTAVTHGGSGGMASENSGTIEDCCVKAYVSTRGNYIHSGGITSRNRGTGKISKCFYYGFLRTATISPLFDDESSGNIASTNEGKLESNYYVITASESTEALGSGNDENIKGIQEKDAGNSVNYPALDFDSVWKIDKDNSPTLQNIVYIDVPKRTGIKVKVNDKEITFDTEPIIESDRTLVPLRATFEALGATVEWDGETKIVSALKDAIKISLKIGEKILSLNGTNKILDVAAKIVNDRTLIPVRAISEAFGCNVEWDNDTKTVIITQ